MPIFFFFFSFDFDDATEPYLIQFYSLIIFKLLKTGNSQCTELYNFYDPIEIFLILKFILHVSFEMLVIPKHKRLQS